MHRVDAVLTHGSTVEQSLISTGMLGLTRERSSAVHCILRHCVTFGGFQHQGQHCTTFVSSALGFQHQGGANRRLVGRQNCTRVVSFQMRTRRQVAIGDFCMFCLFVFSLFLDAVCLYLKFLNANRRLVRGQNCTRVVSSQMRSRRQASCLVACGDHPWHTSSNHNRHILHDEKEEYKITLENTSSCLKFICILEIIYCHPIHHDCVPEDASIFISRVEPLVGCLFVCLFVCLFLGLFVCLFVWLSRFVFCFFVWFVWFVCLSW